MRTLVFILSAAAILFLTTCEEDPTSSNLENRLREIKLFNLNDSSFKILTGSYRGICDLEFSNNSTVVYSAWYTDGNDQGVYYMNKLVNYDFVETTNYFEYHASGYISRYNCYPEINTIFLSVNGDIYRINGNMNELISIANTINAEEDNPILSPDQTTIVYSYLNWQSNLSAIMSFSIITNEIDTIVHSNNMSYYIPLFIDEDSNRLVYSELSSTYTFSTGWIKSINLLDMHDIKILTNEIQRMRVGKTLSEDNKITFSSNDEIYTLDINTSENKFIARGLFSDISMNGDKLVFTTEHELYLINPDGTNLQLLARGFRDNKYFFLPSFSPDGSQIAYVESDQPAFAQ